MVTIHLNNRYYELPAAWNELTKKQLITCIKIIENDWDDDRKRISLMKCLTRISRFRYMICPMAELEEFFYLLNFLFDTNTLTKNLLPAYQKFYGPADFLENIIASEYIFTENHYLLYKEHNSTDDLDSLIGILYRKGKSSWRYDHLLNPAGDRRLPFNDNLIPYYALRVKNWPAEIKRIILHFYEGCRQELVSTYSDCFGGNGEPAKRGMLSLAVMMAETGTFGDFEKVEKLLLHTFFIGLSENIDQARRLTPKSA